MSLPTSWFARVRRLLVTELARLHQALRTLGQRLRDCIAGAVGDAASAVVRDATRAALGDDRPMTRAPPLQEEEEEEMYWPEENEDEFLPEDEPPLTPRPAVQPIQPAPTSRFLDALAWGMGRCLQVPILSALSVFTMAGLVACFGSPLASASASVVRSGRPACSLWLTPPPRAWPC